jgi:transmembrane sensor
VTAADENLSASAAGEIEAAAAAWLRRRQWDWNDELQKQLDAWLDESVAHSVAFWRLEAAWDRGARLEVLRSLPQTVGLQTTTRPTSRRPFLRLAAACAAATVIAAGAAAFWPRAQEAEAVYATAIGERKVVTLGDGTRIELNTNSVLRLAAADDQRKVVLERGEAFFQVEHDAAHPFVVIAGTHRITDLGTKFTVRQGADSLQVTLVEGSAEIGPANAQDKDRSIVLKPGDVALATAASLAVTRKSTSELSNELAWRRGMLIFDRTTLAEAAAEFNRYNKTKLIIADPAIAQRSIGGKFSAADVHGFVEIMQQLLGLRVERRGQDFVISH